MSLSTASSARLLDSSLARRQAVLEAPSMLMIGCRLRRDGNTIHVEPLPPARAADISGVVRALGGLLPAVGDVLGWAGVAGLDEYIVGLAREQPEEAWLWLLVALAHEMPAAGIGIVVGGVVEIIDIAQASAVAVGLLRDELAPQLKPEAVPGAQETQATSTPADVASDEGDAQEKPIRGQMQSTLKQRLRKVRELAMDKAVREGRGESAEADGKLAEDEYKARTPKQIADDLAEAGVEPRPADDKAAEALRKRVERAMETLCWAPPAKPDPISKHEGKDLGAAAGLGREADLDLDLPKGWGRCRACCIGVAKDGEHDCDSCRGKPDFKRRGTLAASNPGSGKALEEARRQADEAFHDRRAAARAQRPRR